MKKLIAIILTTGLLMGTVAFGALAQGRKDEKRPPDARVKVVRRQQPYRKPVVKVRRRKTVVIKNTKDHGVTIVVTRKVKPAPAKKRPHPLYVRPE
jgi:endonuclease YncB( thermonuclease family)